MNGTPQTTSRIIRSTGYPKRNQNRSFRTRSGSIFAIRYILDPNSDSSLWGEVRTREYSLSLGRFGVGGYGSSQQGRRAERSGRYMNKRQKNREKVERERYLDTDFGDVLARLKPLKLDLEFPAPTQAISIRLPREILNRIRIIADEQDVPYQSLIKIWLAERVRKIA